VEADVLADLRRGFEGTGAGVALPAAGATGELVDGVFEKKPSNVFCPPLDGAFFKVGVGPGVEVPFLGIVTQTLLVLTGLTKHRSAEEMRGDSTGGVNHEEGKKGACRRRVWAGEIANVESTRTAAIAADTLALALIHHYLAASPRESSSLCQPYQSTVSARLFWLSWLLYNFLRGYVITAVAQLAHPLLLRRFPASLGAAPCILSTLDTEDLIAHIPHRESW
jgi:hypothetical protein